MSKEVYNPQLGHYVEAVDLPFPKLTSHPGVPVDDRVREEIEEICEPLNKRFKLAGNGLFVAVSSTDTSDEFHAQVTFPPTILVETFLPGWINRSADNEYIGVQVAAHGVRTVSYEPATFDRTTVSSRKREFPFGSCAGVGIIRTVFCDPEENEFEETLTLVEAARRSLDVFNRYVVGNEILEYDFSDQQRENLRRMYVILKRYMNVRLSPFLTRVPSDVMVDELGKGLPDAKSEEMLEALLAESKAAILYSLKPSAQT